MSDRSWIQVLRAFNCVFIVGVREKRSVAFPLCWTLEPKNWFAIFIYLWNSVVIIVVLTFRHLTLTVRSWSKTQIKVIDRLLIANVWFNLWCSLFNIALNFLSKFCIMIFGRLSRSISSLLYLLLSLLITRHHSCLFLVLVYLRLLIIWVNIILRFLNLWL